MLKKFTYIQKLRLLIIIAVPGAFIAGALFTYLLMDYIIDLSNAGADGNLIYNRSSSSSSSSTSTKTTSSSTSSSSSAASSASSSSSSATELLSCGHKDFFFLSVDPDKGWSCNLINGGTTTAPIYFLEASKGSTTVRVSKDRADDSSCEIGWPGGCTITSYYKNSLFELKKHSGAAAVTIVGYFSDSRFTSPVGVWLDYKGVETKELSATDKAEVVKILDSVRKN